MARKLESAQAKGPGGQPIAVEASPGSQKNHYAFNYPLRPGETQFQVSYHMPYSGEASISPKPLADVQHFVVMTPKGMTFTPKNPQQFQSMPDDRARQSWWSPTSSRGRTSASASRAQESFRAEGQQARPRRRRRGSRRGGRAPRRRPRTTIVPEADWVRPIDAPDPLHQYRALILGAFALVLVMGGVYVVSKSNVRAHPAAATSYHTQAQEAWVGHPAGSAGGVADSQMPASDLPDYREPAAPVSDRNALLLEAMKEELFQLEIDRQQGKITPDEYTKAKAALDETIRRALARSKSS